MTVSGVLIPLVLFLGQTSGGDVDPTLPFSEYLDASRNVRLRWGFDLVKDTITFEVMVKTTGWVGFGFSTNGGMAGSDLVIGGVRPSGMYFTVIFLRVFSVNKNCKKYHTVIQKIL